MTSPQACRHLSRTATVSSMASPYSMNRIPDDILIAILQCFIISVHTTMRPTLQRGHYPLWFHLVFVCRRWKEVILNTPSLWSFIEWVPDNTCMQNVLARVKAAPIASLNLDQLHAPLGDYEDIDVWHTALGEAAVQLMELFPRARHLYCDVRSLSDMDTSIVSSFTRPAPFLRSIELKSLLLGGKNVITVFKTLGIVSESEKDASELFPALREVLVDPLTDIWFLQSFANPSLTHLTVRPTFRCKLLEVLNLLPRLQYLQELKVEHRDGPDPSVESAASVKLPHLTLLSLDMHGEMASQLFGKLEFPTSTRITLNIPIQTPELHSTRCALRRLRESSATGSNDALRRLEVIPGLEHPTGRLESGLEVRCWSESNPSEPKFHLILNAYALDQRDQDGRDDIERTHQLGPTFSRWHASFQCMILDEFQLHSLEMVELLNPPVAEKRYQERLKKMHSVKELDFAGDESMVSVLAELLDVSSQRNTTTNAAYLPVLTRLIIRDCPQEGSLWRKLRRALESRKASIDVNTVMTLVWRPLDTEVLFTRDIQEMRRVVPLLTWLK